MLHLTELRLNSQLTDRVNVGFFLAFRSDQPVADIDHRFDLQAEIGKLCTEAIDVNVQALRIERLISPPNGTPKLISRDDAIRRPRESRKDKKLRATQLYWVALVRGVIVSMLYPQETIIVDVFRGRQRTVLFDSCQLL